MTFENTKRKAQNAKLIHTYIILYAKFEKTIDFYLIVWYILYGKNIGIDREWGDPLS